MDAGTGYPALQGLLRPLGQREGRCADGCDPAGKGALCRVFQRISSAGLRQARQDPHRRTSGDLLEDLSAAVLKQAAQQQAALEAALRGQKWFEGVKSSSGPFSRDWPTRLRRKKRPDYTPPDTAALTRKTAPESLETFYVLAFKTTGKSPSRGEIAQLSILKFRRFAPGIRADRLRKARKMV